MELKGAVALITGGASGLGAACARRFAAGGGQVVIFDQDGERAARLAGELDEAARALAGDVTDTAQVEAAIRLAVEQFGGLHINVNCAGIGMALRVTSKNGAHPLDVFEEVIRINLTGTFNVVRLCAMQMAQNSPMAEGERGVIVNTAALAAYDGAAGQAAYAASKGGVVSMTLPLSRDLERDGIRVCAIVPGGAEGSGATDGEGQLITRAGKPDDFAHMVQQIIENARMNGEVVRLGIG